MAGRSDIEAGRAFVRLFLKNDMSRALARALKAGGEQLKQFGQAAASAGKSMMFFGTAVSTPIALAAKRYADFDDTMRAVAGVTQASGQELGMLTEKAKALGAATSFTAVEVGQLMTELGRAGFKPDEVNAMTGAVLNLARATGTDAALSAGIMAASIRQFSLDAEDAQRVSDVLTAGANMTFNTVESLGEALSYAGPVALDFNMSLEDTVAILGQLGNVGIQGSNAGTALRRMLTITGAEAEKLKGIFGVTFVDMAGNSRPLIDVLGEVEQATKHLGTAQRAQKFNEAFGLLGITAASALGKTSVNARELRDALMQAGGTAQRTADMMDSGLGGTLRILMSSVEGLAIQIGETLEPVLTKVAKAMTDASTTAIDWVKANRGLVTAIAAGAVAVIGMGAGLIAIGTAANFAGFVLAGLGSIVAAVFSPLGLLTGAVVAGAIGWAKYTESGQQAMATLTSVAGPFAATMTKTIQGVVSAITQGKWSEAGAIAGMGLKLAFQDAIEGLFGDSQIKNAIYKIAELFGGGRWAEIGTLAWEGLSEALTFGMETIKANWDTWLQGLSDKLYEQMGKVWTWWNDKVQAMTTTLLEKAGLATPANQIQAENDKQRLVEIEQLTQRIAAWEAELAGISNKEMRKEHQETIDNMKMRLKGLRLVEAERQKNGMAGPVGLDIPEPGGPPRADTSVADREAARAAAQARADAAAKRLQELFGMGQTPEQQASIDAGRSAEREKMRKNWEARIAALQAGGAAPAPGAAQGAPSAAPVAPGAAPIAGLTAPVSSVALGPTYSAAAAQAAGQMGGGGSPVEKMTTSINQMAKDLRELGLIGRDQDVSNKQVVTMYERFLAAFSYG